MKPKRGKCSVCYMALFGRPLEDWLLQRSDGHFYLACLTVFSSHMLLFPLVLGDAVCVRAWWVGGSPAASVRLSPGVPGPRVGFLPKRQVGSWSHSCSTWLTVHSFYVISPSFFGNSAFSYYVICIYQKISLNELWKYMLHFSMTLRS